MLGAPNVQLLTLTHCLHCVMPSCCSAVAATPDMKTLIAAGSDKKIKEMEDNSVSRTSNQPMPCTQWCG